MGAQSLEPLANALGQRDADDGQQGLGAARLELERGELPDDGAAAVAQPVFERLERVFPGGAGIEREPHHRLVVAHQSDLFVRADPRPRRHRQVDRAQAVMTPVDEVAEEDQDAALAPMRLPRRLVEQGVRAGRAGRECRRRRRFPCPARRRAAR